MGRYWRSIAADSLLAVLVVGLPLAVVHAGGRLDLTLLLVAVGFAAMAGGLVAARRLLVLSRLRRWLQSSMDDADVFDVDQALAENVVWPVQAIRGELDRVQRVSAAQRTMFERLADALPDPMFFVDDEHVVVHPNLAARQAFTIERDRMPLALVIRDPGLLGAIQAAGESGQSSQLAVGPVGGRERRFAARVEPMAFEDGRRGALVALREQSEQVMIERMRADFIANVSHELRTPLSSLLGFIETLQGPARDDAAARERFLATMHGEAWRMKRLVDDLLSLSRLEMSRGPSTTDTCDLADVVGRTLGLLRPVAEQAGVSLDLETGDGKLAVSGDADQLAQLTSNLIENAIKYGGSGGRVAVTVDRLAAAPAEAGLLAGRPAVMVAVSDSGPGIAPQHLPRLTERFYRVDRGRSRQVGGTGLGLAIAKHIVGRHGGHLDIKSMLGEGSTFSFYLPPAVARHQAVTNRS